MAVTLPPLSLSTGPAISGGPTESGGVGTGDFYVTQSSWQDRLLFVAPLVLVGLGAIWMISKKR